MSLFVVWFIRYVEENIHEVWFTFFSSVCESSICKPSESHWTGIVFFRTLKYSCSLKEYQLSRYLG